MKEKKSGSIDTFYVEVESPVGTLYLVFAGKKLTGIDFKKPAGILRRDKAPFPIRKELHEYFEHGREEFMQETELREGTEFDKKVWLVLKEDIPGLKPHIQEVIADMSN